MLMISAHRYLPAGQGIYAFRSLVDAGARVTFGSDAPVENLDPLTGFYAGRPLFRFCVSSLADQDSLSCYSPLSRRYLSAWARWMVPGAEINEDGSTERRVLSGNVTPNGC
jgi:hypothetical protein